MPVYDFPEVEPPDKEPGVGKVVFAVVVIGCICVVVSFIFWVFVKDIFELGEICLNMI